MWQCVSVTATSEGGQQFVWGGVDADSAYDLKPDEIIWYQHHAQGRRYEKHQNTVLV